MRRVLAAALAIPFLALAACPAADRTTEEHTGMVTTADAEESLNQVTQRYEQASQAGDRQALERMYTGDAWVSFGDGRSGSPSQMLPDTAENLTLERRRMEAIGDWAYSTGTWRTRITAPDGSQQEVNGDYLTIFRRENGEWRIREVVGNLSEESQRRMAQMQQAPPAQQR